MKMIGVVLTIGKSVYSEVFFLRDCRPDFVAMLCTPSSRQYLQKICDLSALDVSTCQLFEVPEKARDTEALDTDAFMLECEKAFDWVRTKVGEDGEILACPTAGRKWMSAGLSMYAARTDCRVYYVDAEYEQDTLVPNTERIVLWGNKDDFAGMSECDRGVELFNRLDFVGAKEIFSRLKPKKGAAKRALYRDLATICDALSAWERFEHYSHEATWLDELSDALEDTQALTEELPIDLSVFIQETDALRKRILEVSRAPRPSLLAVTDLFYNAYRRIESGRLDDGVARLYRALEACAQWLLSLRRLDSSELDWEAVSDVEKQRYRARASLHETDGLPVKLPLVMAARLVSCLEVDWTKVPEEMKASFVERHGFDLLDRSSGLPLTWLALPDTLIDIEWSRTTQEVRSLYRLNDREGGQDEATGNPTDAEANGGSDLPKSLSLAEAIDVDPKAVWAKTELFFTLFKQKESFVFAKHIKARNKSILAHGWDPVTQDEAEKFRDAVQGLLQRLGADLEGWSVPKLPKLWT